VRAALLAGLGCALAVNLAEAQENEQQLLPSNIRPGLHFGWSIDVEGDTAIVGAFGNQSPDALGALYVYERRHGAWMETQTLRPSDGRDTFATTVSLSGNTVLVGSHANAYVFVKTTAGWTEQAILPVYGGLGAEVVSLDGDTAVVGAPFDKIVGPHGGSAHVFVRRNGVWSLQQRVIPRDSAAEDFTGPAAVQGNRLLVATPCKGTRRGAVYFFERFGTTWVQRQKLLADDGQPEDFFGAHVALDGDTAVISTRHAWIDNSVYVFRYDGQHWKETQKLRPDRHELGDLFGDSMSLVGDALLVGSANELDGTTSWASGAAYLFERRGDTWIRTHRLVASDTSGDRYFGLGVAVSSDAILVGAPMHERSGDRAGLVYAYDRTRASVTYDNGRGVNVDRLTAEGARIGFPWEATLDVVAPHLSGPAFLLLAGSSRPGTLVQHGTAELFLGDDLRVVLGPAFHAGQGDSVHFSTMIPVVPALLGSSWCAQGLVLGGPIGLTNAAMGVVR
jgi:hypothetical protein